MIRVLWLPLLLTLLPARPVQDPDLRSEAVQLMEMAHKASISPDPPNYEQTVTFRVLDGSSTQEGTFTRVEVQGTGRRVEIHFGDFHATNVQTSGQLATNRNREVAPPEVITLRRILPIFMVRFDQEDVIRGVTTRQVSGQSLRCISFDTTAGNKTDHNELCVDPVNGTLVTEKLGDEYIENGEFFRFGDALLPGKIRYSFAGTPKLEIFQRMSLLTDSSANVLAAPPDAKILRVCKTWRRPIGESMPQPAPGTGNVDFDVVVRGLVGVDGKIHEAVVQTSPRPDANAEALNLVESWTFTPAMCEGHPNVVQVSLVLHFHRR